jgi:hypothetical protein
MSGLPAGIRTRNQGEGSTARVRDRLVDPETNCGMVDP